MRNSAAVYSTVAKVAEILSTTTITEDCSLPAQAWEENLQTQYDISCVDIHEKTLGIYLITSECEDSGRTLPAVMELL